MKKLLIAAVGIVAALVLSSCSSSSADVSPENTSIGVVIDVRTPAEYAAGHVASAINIDVESGAFDRAIATLDSSVTYVVYCHSGRRSAIAAEKMSNAGLTVLDGGAFDNMIAQGWTIGS